MHVDYDKTSLIGGNGNPYGDVCYSIAREGPTKPDSRTLKGSAVMQVLIGVLMLICGVLILLFVDCQFAKVYVGVWSGVWFILSGWMGLYASSDASKGWIITYLTMSSVSLLASFAAIVLKAYSLILEENAECLRLEEILLIAAASELVVSIFATILCSMRLNSLKKQDYGFTKRSPIYKPISSQ
ncbi:uncharacterized protein LOC117119318 [Anneissia japonica]|uniref:uncharacterized protein LOC117119318 n=1 Tax=Anneissia japonica TaxID=1529436 RepID=UPI0014259F94|nr:uncharacterized protein LOC117119318 [Anneissia japonica]